MGNLGLMSKQGPDAPKPAVDQELERATGGADADVSESDVGAASEGRPTTPDQPLSAQQDEEEIPDEIQTPEEPEVTKGEDESASEPTG